MEVKWGEWGEMVSREGPQVEEQKEWFLGCVNWILEISDEEICEFVVLE